MNTLEQLFQLVCEILKEHPEKVKSKSRKKDLVIARQIFCKLASKHTRPAVIAETVNRDRTTVLHNIARFEQLRQNKNEEELREKYRSCKFAWKTRLEINEKELFFTPEYSL